MTHNSLKTHTDDFRVVVFFKWGCVKYIELLGVLPEGDGGQGALSLENQVGILTEESSKQVLNMLTDEEQISPTKNRSNLTNSGYFLLLVSQPKNVQSQPAIG